MDGDNTTGKYTDVIPFIIIHRGFKKAVGIDRKKNIKQLGTKNLDGEIALASKNIKDLGLSEDENKEKLALNVCIYRISQGIFNELFEQTQKGKKEKNRRGTCFKDGNSQ